MPLLRLDEDPGQLVLHAQGAVCTSTREVVESEPFERLVALYLAHLRAHDAPLLDALGIDGDSAAAARRRSSICCACSPTTRSSASRGPSPDARRRCSTGGPALHRVRRGPLRLLAGLRPLPRRSRRAGAGRPRRHAPYRAFNASLEALAALVRDLYRDVAENITGAHPRVYRQVHAGAELGVVVAPRQWPAPAGYARAARRHPVRDPRAHVPAADPRPAGQHPLRQFTEVSRRPAGRPAARRRALALLPGDRRPPRGLRLRRAALLRPRSVARQPVRARRRRAGGRRTRRRAALTALPPTALARFGEQPTVFFDDAAHGLLVGAVPLDDRFAYFGYLKKMVLTLHNVAAMKRGLMPYHGAFTRLVLPGRRRGRRAAHRRHGDRQVGDPRGAAPGRRRAGRASCASSPTTWAPSRWSARRPRARAGLRHRDRRLRAPRRPAAGLRHRPDRPGHHHEPAEGQRPGGAAGDHPRRGAARLPRRRAAVRQQLRAGRRRPPDHRAASPTPSAALAVFREGRAMSKGTTSASGLVANYFANIFGPAQRPAQHDALAERTFAAAFAGGAFVGQLRTQTRAAGLRRRGTARRRRGAARTDRPRPRKERHAREGALRDQRDRPGSSSVAARSATSTPSATTPC